MTPKTERFEFRVEQNILERIDEWRSKQRGLPSRSEAIRKLIEKAIGHSEDEQLFQLARFNILAAALAEGTRSALPNYYVYAWEHSVYPFFDDSIHLHAPFATHFRVSPDMVDDLSRFLGDRFDADENPSFYEIEDHYGVGRGGGDWERMTLIFTCRYMFLQDMFNQKFWADLLRGTDHPIEAKSIVGTYERPRHFS